MSGEVAYHGVFSDPHGPKCPLCGFLDRNGWDLSLDEDFEEINCGSCDALFEASREISTTYRSRAKPKVP